MQTNNPFKFKVFSLNVRGIRDQTKRRRIFTFLKKQNATIYFLQETYSEQRNRREFACICGSAFGSASSKVTNLTTRLFAKKCPQEYFYKSFN